MVNQKIALFIGIFWISVAHGMDDKEKPTNLMTKTQTCCKDLCQYFLSEPFKHAMAGKHSFNICTEKCDSREIPKFDEILIKAKADRALYKKNGTEGSFADFRGYYFMIQRYKKFKKLVAELKKIN